MYLALKWPFDSLAASGRFVAIAIHRIWGGHWRSNRTVYADARRKLEGWLKRFMKSVSQDESRAEEFQMESMHLPQPSPWTKSA
jgi:hypothetical protein